MRRWHLFPLAERVRHEMSAREVADTLYPEPRRRVDVAPQNKPRLQVASPSEARDELMFDGRESIA